MKKELKGQIIESISAQLQKYPNFYITDIEGLNAGQTSKLRRECFNSGVVLSVVKNTLFAHVLKGMENEEMKTLEQTLVGNTAIMYTEVPAAPGKLIKKLQKEGFQKPVVKGAFVQDCVYIGDCLNELAAIKTKEELIGDIIGLLQSPIRNVLSALENKDAAAENAEAAEAPAEAPEAAPAE
ncbi:MAG: 50S ribosomal protein L10 [Bacteroidales bacterium]|nr:50S ribosomal protein L10 [Candidatus Cryptobacteroides equifaecalis]